LFREFSVVKDNNDIPREAGVVRYKTCAIGHHGICKSRDAQKYKVLGTLRAGLQQHIVKADLPVGSAIAISGWGAGDDLLHELFVILAHSRKRDPVLAICVAMHRDGDRLKFVVDADEQDTLQVLLDTDIASRILQDGVSKVCGLDFPALMRDRVRLRRTPPILGEVWG
jgi:hypothetical protein